MEDIGSTGSESGPIVFAVSDTTDTSASVPGAVLLPGRYYVWYVAATNWRGFERSESYFLTQSAPDPHGSWSTNFTYPPPDEYGNGTGLTGSVESFCSFDDGEGVAVYAGGWLFATANDGIDPGDGIARWDGASWSPLASDPTNGNAPGGVFRYDGTSGLVSAMTVFDPDGAGSAFGECLVLAGEFAAAGASFTESTSVANIAFYRRSDHSFHALGGGLSMPFPSSPSVRALAVFDDDGAGPHPACLYAAGEFEVDLGAAGVAKGIARYDPSANNGAGAWLPVGAGLVIGTQNPDDTDSEASVYSLCVYDDGGGPRLYAGGWFTKSGTASLNNLARWSGSVWESVGDGVALDSESAVPVVFCMIPFDDDGDGPNPASLFVGGQFDHAGSVAAANLARWDGAAWTDVGGVTGGYYYPPAVKAMAVMDPDGPGPQPEQLYIGGLFYFAGGHPVNHLARLDPDGWHALGGGVAYPDIEFVPSVHSLAQRIDAMDSHRSLYVGGFFTQATGAESQFIGTWSPHCLADYDRNDFINGEDFDAFLADFEVAAPAADIDGNGFVNGDDFDLFAAAFQNGC